MPCSSQHLPMTRQPPVVFPRRIEPLQSGAWDVIMIPEGGADTGLYYPGVWGL